jgi:hypothetical protein
MGGTVKNGRSTYGNDEATYGNGEATCGNDEAMLVAGRPSFTVQSGGFIEAVALPAKKDGRPTLLVVMKRRWWLIARLSPPRQRRNNYTGARHFSRVDAGPKGFTKCLAPLVRK